jgi:hypothetical protein
MVSFRMKSSLLLLGKPHVRQERKEGRKEINSGGSLFFHRLSTWAAE